jgi:hypothetical protein
LKQPLTCVEIGEDDTRHAKGRSAGTSTDEADIRDVDQLGFVYYQKQLSSYFNKEREAENVTLW